MSLVATYIQLAEGGGPDELRAELGAVNEAPGYTRPGTDDFRIVVPWSGGMDSTSLVWMAIDAGWPVVPLYVDTGATYSAQEQRLQQVLAIPRLEKLAFDVEYVKFDVIDLARNAVILAAAAEWATQRGWWGHIWFGNGGDPGETTVRGGDKSFWFETHINATILGRGLPWTVQSPLIGMTKADQVRLWADRGREALFRRTLSCTSPVAMRHCRACISCAMRWLAWYENKIDLWPDTDMRPVLQELIEKREVQGEMTGTHADRQRAMIKTYDYRQELSQ